jgi:hypothetical protein
MHKIEIESNFVYNLYTTFLSFGKLTKDGHRQFSLPIQETKIATHGTVILSYR